MTTTTTKAFTGPLTANARTAIPFDFQAVSATEVGVLRDGVEETGFAVTLNGDGTGSVLPNISWGSDTVYIYSKPRYTQPTAFQRFAPVYPDQFSTALDRHARSTIALKGLIDRTMKTPLGETGPAYLSVADRAENYLAHDAAGNPVPGISRAGMAGLLSNVAANAVAIADEAASRANADAVEMAARIAAVNNEAAVRTAGDNALSGRMDDLYLTADVAMRASELAMLASLTAPKVYPDTASGLAAVGEGDTFWVQGVNAPELYREVAGVATLVTIMRLRNTIAAKDFGADPAASDNRVPIQAAIDYIDSIGGGTLYIDALYNIGVGTVLADGGGYYCLRLGNNITLTQLNPACGLRVKDNAGDYRAVVGGKTQATTNTHVLDLVVDQNVANNPNAAIPSTAVNSQNGIVFYGGAGCSIRDCEVRGGGVWHFAINGMSKNFAINNCTAHYDATPATIASGTHHDNSSFYCSGFDYEFVGNRAYNVGPLPYAVTAFELHGAGYHYDGLVCDGYQTGSNVVGENAPATRPTCGIVGGSITGTRTLRLVHLWALTGSHLKGASITRVRGELRPDLYPDMNGAAFFGVGMNASQAGDFDVFLDDIRVTSTTGTQAWTGTSSAMFAFRPAGNAKVVGRNLYGQGHGVRGLLYSSGGTVTADVECELEDIGGNPNATSKNWVFTQGILKGRSHVKMRDTGTASLAGGAAGVNTTFLAAGSDFQFSMDTVEIANAAGSYPTLSHHASLVRWGGRGQGAVATITESPSLTLTPQSGALHYKTTVTSNSLRTFGKGPPGALLEGQEILVELNVTATAPNIAWSTDFVFYTAWASPATNTKTLVRFKYLDGKFRQSSPVMTTAL